MAVVEKPEDLILPNAVVSRIIKDSLPNSVKVSKEASAAIAKAASVFVLYTTSCSNNVAMKANRKTIHGNDVIAAMTDMEFDKFIKPLENSLESWKKFQQKKKESAAAKKKADSEKEKEPLTTAAATSANEDEPMEAATTTTTTTTTAEENKENEDEEE